VRRLNGAGQTNHTQLKRPLTMTSFNHPPSLSLKRHSLLVVLSFFLLAGCTDNLQPADGETDEFSQHVRTTEARTPAGEQAGFTLPPGFEIQLFASEPDIGKPLNMAFDAKGRMWLTQSYEYPFPDTTGNPKDKITILEDTDGDGRADQFTVFADSLNIPIGILPVADGAVAYSIPGIYHFIDRDGDDRVDERKVLYTGFRYEDTHGMINNLARLWDGWIHADHGFANISKVAGTDGDTIVLNSGNTFRFRLDGSRIEFTTTGRVNPFGYAFDELGYTYSVDCHSSPIYQIIRGADYPHFGKKPTGIGFGPALMEHNYGSTALAGLEYYLDTQFPEAYQNSFFLGDVVKCRVYRSTMEMQGTTPLINWEEDFVVSDDPWFRPVDVKLGPDGALYIADFYNRIIGHYEVPLDHPGRDRRRGRIWRIVYRGEEGKAGKPVKDWTRASLSELIDGLDQENLPLRMTIADQIVDRFGREAVDPLRQRMETRNSPRSFIQGMWILYRLDALPGDLLARAAAGDDVTVAVHALRIMFEYKELHEKSGSIAVGSLSHNNPHVQRQAAMVVSRHPRTDHIAPLLRLRHSIAEEDSHFLYSVRQSLRDQLRDASVMQWVLNQPWEERDARTLAELTRGVDLADAGRFLLKHLQRYPEPEEQLTKYARHAARLLSDGELDQLVGKLRKQAGGNPDLAFVLFQSIRDGRAQEGKKMSAGARAWGIELASDFLKTAPEPAGQWQVIPHSHYPYARNTWQLADLAWPGSAKVVRVLASESIPNNGREASQIHSPDFPLTGTVSFLLFGHRDEPGENETPASPANRVELRLAANDSLLAKTEIAEPNAARAVNWSVQAPAGEKAYLAVIDGSTRRGEFIAIGQLATPGPQLPAEGPNQRAERQIFAAQIAKEYRVGALENLLEGLLTNPKADIHARTAAAGALLELAPQHGLAAVESLLRKSEEPIRLKEDLSLLISGAASPAKMALLMEVMGDLSYDKQKEIVLTLANSPTGVNGVLNAAAQAIITPRLLLERQVQERLSAGLTAEQTERLAAITAGAKAPNTEIQSLIDTRIRGFQQTKHEVSRGKQIFTQFCAPCHQIKREGGAIGPQLDGIGNWGLQALNEKILDPNRNISKAFRNYTIRLKDGNVAAGLFRREEGQLLVFADAAGNEFSIEKSQIAEQKRSPYTLMPDHFSQAIPEQDYYALLAFLLNER
jgi:putative heme-binding domain-containing protein